MPRIETAKNTNTVTDKDEDKFRLVFVLFLCKRRGQVRVERNFNANGVGMLTRKEYEIMGAVYSLCRDKGVCLISSAEILALLSPRRKYTEEDLENTLNELALDNYFELLSSERKGEKMYVISLKTNGYAFKRSFAQMRRDAVLKIFWAVTSAVVAFLVGLILKRIF